MKSMILATAATLTLGLGLAHADGGGSNGANPDTTLFTSLPGVFAKSATGRAPTATTTQGTADGRPVPVYASQSMPGMWLYQPEANRTGSHG
jgi:hypothetical protein